ncbi:hypothetical protein [Chitinimonas koreensis]|uniref:hypothetical protein n=1 Tax=Chitinimonas koreensis TaxID=356302 RepID=UPI0012FABA40|nr:hypothetical protein [Chitinimonas koreensis]QNM98594.1 hypothetical protein H9L41_10430 [Chitinimonas koreensis]
MKQDLLEKITVRLHENATNYSVFLHAYEVPYVQQADSAALIRTGLGVEAVLGGVDEVEVGAVCTEVEDALLYPGDDGAGPGNLVFQNELFIELLNELKGEIRRLASASFKIERFWLQDGHPAYPVFWDFAFLFWGKDKATLFIGSSSD